MLRKCFSADIVSHHLYSIPGIKSEWGLQNSDLFTKRIEEKLGVQGEVKFRSTSHLLEYTTKGEVMWDDIIILFDVEVSRIVKDVDAMYWFSIDEIKSLNNRHKPIDIYVLDNCKTPYLEIVMNDNFNLRNEDL
jgi:hypothetical protein